jgi:hypothetical protein
VIVEMAQTTPTNPPPDFDLEEKHYFDPDRETPCDLKKKFRHPDVIF